MNHASYEYAMGKNGDHCCHRDGHLHESKTLTGAVSQNLKIIYTCPMHLQISQKEPGNCPLCGMALEPKNAAQVTDDTELKETTQRFWLAVVLSVPLVLAVMFLHLPGFPFPELARSQAYIWVQMVLATPVVLWAGRSFFERGGRSLVTLRFNMFTLIALGVGVAYGYSLFASFLPRLVAPNGGMPDLYYEAASVIVTLVLLGQVLELKARNRTSTAVRELLELAPETARIIHADGKEEDVPLSEARVGDLLMVKPGGRVPVDGVVVSGSAIIDQSMMTGESVPAECAKDSKVVGGTIVLSGGFNMLAEKVGEDMLLSRIVELVAKAQRSRAPIQKLVDTVSAWFVPAVLVIATISAIVWYVVGPEPSLANALLAAVAVLIIACPCALGLATPMSIMVGTGRGAKLGILIRDAEALEVLGKIDTLLVDKTGTLTLGHPKLTSVQAVNGFSEDDVLALAAALEQNSEHPISFAVVEGARTKGLEIPKTNAFQSESGKGIHGKIGNCSLILGNPKLLEEEKIDISPLVLQADGLRAEGCTVVFLSVDGKLAGILAAADPIKEDAVSSIAKLKALGIEVIMLTGDNRVTAQAVAGKLDIAQIEADVLPEEKNAVVRKYQEQSRIVAMAGDGVNDAPALTQALVGIAMGTGTDIAMESAGVTLVKGDVAGIVRAILLSRATMANIRQNLFLAFIYNALSVPVAAGVFYPLFGWTLSPIIASATMALSSVAVISNALRLKSFA